MSLAIMSSLTALTTYFHYPNPTVSDLKVVGLERFAKYTDQTDKALLKFDLKADLRSVFNWNVKQIFVYIVAEYTSSHNKLNQVVIWDKIIPTAKEASLKVKAGRVKYFLADMHDDLRNANVKLKLMWDIMPVWGRLFAHEVVGSEDYQMPTVYLASKKSRN